jgi:hypothetical protein
MGGLMSITGAPGEGPMRVGIPVADLTAGLFCAIGILTALPERDVSGEGQWVQTSLLQAQIFMLDFQAARWLMEKDVAKQAGNNHPTSIPTGLFKTSDGYINIAMTGGRIWERCAQAIGAINGLQSLASTVPRKQLPRRDSRRNSFLGAQHTVVPATGVRTRSATWTNSRAVLHLGEATEAALRALRILPRFPEPLNGLASVAFMQGELDKAFRSPQKSNCNVSAFKAPGTPPPLSVPSTPLSGTQNSRKRMAGLQASNPTVCRMTRRGLSAMVRPAIPSPA